VNRLAAALAEQLTPYGWQHPSDDRVSRNAAWVWWQDGCDHQRNIGCSPTTVMYYDPAVTLFLVNPDPPDLEAIVATLYVWRVIPRPAGRMVSGGW
jgi:hypothetical protein